MFNVVKFLLALTFVYNVASMGLPEYIKSCSRNDPNLNECALKSAKESLGKFSLGDASRGLTPLDPLFVKEMTVFIPNENGLKIVFKDNTFTGFSTIQMKDLKFDLNKKIITADALANLDVKSHYDLSGKLMVVPVKSNGPATIRLKNTLLHVRIWYEHVEIDGKVHWNIIKHDIKYQVEKASFKLDNLLNDKNLSDQINNMLNQFWQEIVNEVGPSICESLSGAVVDSLAILLKQVPYDDLMPE